MSGWDRAAGTASGAAKGAAVGSAFGPLGIAIGGALGGARGFLGSESTSSYNDALRRSTEAMEEGELGFSENQKDRMAATQQRAAGQQIGAMQSDIAQQGLQGVGAGQQAKMMSALAESAAEAGAQGRRAAEEQSAMLAESRRRETMDRLNEQRIESESMIDSVFSMLGDPSLGAAGAAGQYNTENMFKTAAQKAKVTT